MKQILITVGSVLATILSTTAYAEWTGNFGWTSEYIFRGISQSDSSAFVGVDYEDDGIFLGTWAADVGQGAEVDLYLGYSGEIGEAITYRFGASGYLYTDEFDDTYKELNLELSYDILSVSANFGEYDNFDESTQDYAFYTVMAESDGVYALVGLYGGDFDGEFYEAGYGTDVAGFELSISIVHGTSSLLGDSDNSIAFGIQRTLRLR